MLKKNGDRWVKLNMKHGISSQIKSCSVSCLGSRNTYYDEVSSCLHQQDQIA